MKLCSLLFVATALHICSNVCGDDCMSALQLIAATRKLCTQHRDNTALWQQVIDCHKPISEEFLRHSGEAQCPSPKYAEDPLEYDYSIQDVFLNTCALIDGSGYNRIRTSTCLLFGRSNPFVMSHSSEVAAVKKTWGNDVPCNVGKCILKLGLNDT